MEKILKTTKIDLGNGVIRTIEVVQPASFIRTRDENVDDIKVQAQVLLQHANDLPVDAIPLPPQDDNNNQ